MRILVSAYVCDPVRGSEPGYAWNLVVHLAQRGHEVEVLTRTFDQSMICNEASGLSLPNLRFHFVQGPRWVEFLRKYLPYYFHYYFWQISALEYAQTTLPNVELVHHVTWGSLRIPPLLWKMGKPFLFGPLGGGQVAPASFARFFGLYWPQEVLRTIQVKSLPYFATVRQLVRNTNLFLAANRETADLVSRAKAARVKLFCDSALPDDFSPHDRPLRLPAPWLRILWVGGVLPRKGLNFALFALQKLKVPFRFTILGDGPLKASIPAWIQQYGLQGKVDYLGRVPRMSLGEYYSTHDVFLFPSLREAFGGQLLEAMAYGLPIVTLNQFGARDFVPDEAGFKVDVASPEETADGLSEALNRLWEQPDLRENMGKASFEYAKSHSWTKTILELETIYREILQQHSAAV